MKINYSNIPTTFKDLEAGDCFFLPDVNRVCMKTVKRIDNRGFGLNAVNLENGKFECLAESDLILKLDATLQFNRAV